MRELVPYSVPVIHSAVEHTSSREGVKRRAGPIAKCLPCWSWKGGYETINRLIHWANWMRARETGELRGDPRGERRAMALLFRSFIGPVLRLGRGKEGEPFIKAPFRAPLPGTEWGLIRLRLWSDWAYSLGQERDGRDEARENPNHRPNQVRAAWGRRNSLG